MRLQRPADRPMMARIPTLDGWRAVAIGAVTLHHLTKCFYQHEADYDLSITRYGAFGVDLFFAISGLLITKLLLDEWRDKQSFDLPGFYIRRAFRILPPYLLFLAVYSITIHWRSPIEMLSCLFFFRNYAPVGLASAGTLHLWSLSVEEHFYLLWPGLLAWVGARRSKTLAVNLALGVALWRTVESQLPMKLLPMVVTHFRTDLRLDGLLWGCAFAFLLDDQKQRQKLTRQLRLPVWLAMAAVLGLCIVFYSEMTSVLVAALIPVLLLGTLTHPHWRISRALDLPPVAWIGRISYSLYLWQGLLLAPGWDHATAWWRLWPWNLAMLLAVATASYYWMEKPLIRLGHRLSASRGSRLARPKLETIGAEPA
jgi:peptidoglycan/LPS O-acetylase OafA/YrhL